MGVRFVLRIIVIAVQWSCKNLVVYFIIMIVRKKLFDKSTAKSFVITQHEESIYERPDIKSIIGGCNAIEKPMIPFEHLHSWKCNHRTMMQIYSILGVNGLYNDSRR